MMQTGEIWGKGGVPQSSRIFLIVTLAVLGVLESIILSRIAAPIFNSQARRLEQTCGLLVVLLTLSVLLYDEYKLTVNGLLFDLLARGFIVIGKAFSSPTFGLTTPTAMFRTTSSWILC